MGTMRAWQTQGYGAPSEVLRLDTVDIPEPAADEVRVRVEAIPLNLNDLERVTGGPMMVRPEPPFAPGMEVFGVVDACGPGAEAWQGRRVAAMTRQAHGGYAEWALAPAAATFEIPDDIALPGAAALLIPFHLAWLGLVERAGLRSGESVLVHAGAGGSGSAAIQLARHRGARVLATAGGPDKAALCRELGADVAIDHHSEDFAANVLEGTDGRGVDVVFDNVGPAVFEQTLGVIATGGRYLAMGFASDKAAADEPHWVPRQIMGANISLGGVLLAYGTPEVASFVKDLMGISMLPHELGARITEEVVELVRSGDVRPVVGAVVDFADLPAGLIDLAERRTTGRTVVMVSG